MRAALAAALGIAPGGLLSGCASTNIEDAFPAAPAPQAQTATAPLPAAGPATQSAVVASAPAQPARGAKDTGTYPNLNIRPQAANQQISDEEKAAQIGSLTAAQQDHAAKLASSAKGSTDPALLRKLAKTHADETLKTIEAEQ